MKSISYQDYLIKSLKNSEEAAGYLSAALKGGDPRVFFMALQNVVQAQGGITKLAKKTHKSRTSLYKAISETGNPYFKNTNDILSAMNMHFAVIPNKTA
jgi:probable addiction module antidote protein